jgi:hypothetical protein
MEVIGKLRNGPQLAKHRLSNNVGGVKQLLSTSITWRAYTASRPETGVFIASVFVSSYLEMHPPLA